MVKKVSHNQFRTLIKAYYKQQSDDGRKFPILVYGTFGIGKSQVVCETTRDIAAKKGKKFVEWNKITREEKDKLFKDPSKAFVLIDIRLSEFDTADTKGLPDFKKDSDAVEWKIPFWAKILEHPDSDGVLFFDEINLATPLVISSVYKIIYDRVINEGKINDNWLIIGAGNKDEDRAYTHEMAAPVRDRAGEVELTAPSIDDWTEWAVEKHIDPRIIGFLNWKSSNLHNVNFEDGQKFTTERGWARLNYLIQGITEYPTLELVSGTAIGEGIAREFVAFCKIRDSVDIAEIIKNPAKLEKVTEISTKYFVVTALAEQYKDNKLNFERFMRISETLDKMKNAEFVALFWRLSIRYAPIKFKDDFMTKEINNPLRDKYHKYIYG